MLATLQPFQRNIHTATCQRVVEVSDPGSAGHGSEVDVGLVGEDLPANQPQRSERLRSETSPNHIYNITQHQRREIQNSQNAQKSIMPALDHRAARGHAPFIAARCDKDAYSQMVLYRDRSPSPSRGNNELIMRGYTAKKGQSGAIAVALSRIQHTLEKRSLDLKLAVLGANSPETIVFMVKISDAWYYRGLYKEAEPLELNIVDFRRARLGDQHPDTIKALRKIGVTWKEQGRYQDSECAQLQVYSKGIAILGDEHRDTLEALLELSNLWRLLGRYVDAELAQRKVFKVRCKVLGRMDIDTIKALANLASTLADLGRHEEAEATQVQVLKDMQEVLGAKHRDAIWAMRQLATTWYRQGRYEKAEAMQQQVLELRKEVLGPTHPSTLLSMSTLALTLHELQRYDEADALMSKAAELRKKILGPGHEYTIESEQVLERWRNDQEAREAEAAIKALLKYKDDPEDNDASVGWSTEDEDGLDKRKAYDEKSDGWETVASFASTLSKLGMKISPFKGTKTLGHDRGAKLRPERATRGRRRPFGQRRGAGKSGGGCGAMAAFDKVLCNRHRQTSSPMPQGRIVSLD